MPYTYLVTASDADADALSFSLSSAPGWLSLVDHGEGTATLSGTPRAGDAGNVAVELRVSDAVLETIQQFTLTVTALGATGSIVSDDFSPEVTLGAQWRFLDPRGDSQHVLTGSHALLRVASGVSHDLWRGSAQAIRLLQPSDDGDFGIETRFESVPSEKHQLQGLVVQQDDTTFIRAGVFFTGSGVKSVGKANVRILAKAPKSSHNVPSANI